MCKMDSEVKNCPLQHSEQSLLVVVLVIDSVKSLHFMLADIKNKPEHCGRYITILFYHHIISLLGC